MTNFEHATRIPLLIKAAAGTAEAAASGGRRALGLVEAVDIMPSLIELAIPGPPYPTLI